MKGKRLFLMLSVLIMSMQVYAQTISVKGTVTSSADGQPIVGVFVGIRGNNTAGTTTDIDGKYSLDGVPSDATLFFSMLGYSEITLPVTGKSILDVIMDEEATSLDQVVVVGYGSMKKSDLTGSVSSVNSDVLKETISTSFDQMLQGKVAGVQITSNSGAPGAASSIRIRGASSINNSNEPLYIIDGIIFSGDGNEIGGFDWAGGTNGQNKVSPLSTIAPQDIVSIDILKDASATAIYGANGANGVVLITTKRGKVGAPVIAYDGYVAMQQIGNQLDMMDLSEYAQYVKEVGSFTGQNVDEAYGDPSILGKGTNWQDAIFRTAWMQSHQISLSGGSEKVQYAASGGYTDQDGVVTGSNFNRFNSRVNVDGTIRKWLKAGASLAFTHTDETITNNDGTDGVILQALTMSPSIPVYNFDGSWAGPESTNAASQYNPVWLAQMKTNSYKRDRTMGNFYLSFDFLKHLNFKTEYGFDYSNNRNSCFVPSYSFGIIEVKDRQVMQRNDNSMYWNWRNYLTYDQHFGDKHHLIVMAGAEMSESSWEGNQLIKNGLTSNEIKMATADGNFVSNSGWKDASTMVSFFGRINYNLMERYLFTATVRGDASSKFGPNHKWGVFPSGAFAWRISNEPWLKESKVISNLKLRLGYGMVGNSNIGTYLYGSTMTSADTPLGTAYHMSNISNPDLKWETSVQYNVGLDYGMFNERIALSVDVYQKETKDLLLQVPVPSYLGGTDWEDISSPMVNIGKTRNRGMDIQLNTLNFDRKNFQWTSNLVVSLNRNEVLALNDDAQVLYGSVDWYSEFQTATMIKVGQPIGVFYGYTVDRLFTDTQDILDSPVQVEDPTNPGTNLVNQTTGVYPGDIKFKDLNNDGVINDDDQSVIGDPNPDFTFGFTNVFSFYNFDITLALTGSYGGDILNFSRYLTEGQTSIWNNQSSAVVNRAQIAKNADGTAYLTNVGTNMPRPSTNDFNRNNRMSTRWIEDGSYLRIQTLSIAYNIPSKVCNRIGLNNLKVYLNAQNLWTFTNYSGYDPEIGAYNQSALLQNIDRGRYPAPRMFTLGVNIGF